MQKCRYIIANNRICVYNVLRPIEAQMFDGTVIVKIFPDKVTATAPLSCIIALIRPVYPDSEAIMEYTSILFTLLLPTYPMISRYAW